jgi:mRNA interferase YafQ
MNMLSKDERLPRRYFDHPLSGEWSDHRDCRIRPDLILVYRKPEETSLELVCLGSYSELGYDPAYLRGCAAALPA